MAAKTRTLVSILKLTKRGPVARDHIAQEASISKGVTDELLKKFCEGGFIEYKDRIIEVSSNQRAKIAIHALNLGADIEKVCKALEWLEFENLAATILEANNFDVRKRYRFKWLKRKWEIDILGYKEPLIISMECKRWSRSWHDSDIKKIAEAQALRSEMLAEALPSIQKRIGLTLWKKAIIIPVILSLIKGSIRFHNTLPIVPILQLQNFLTEFSTNITSLKRFQTYL